MVVSLAPWRETIPFARQRRLDAMADELARQAANLAAAEYRWLKLLGEYDAQNGWVWGGARSCAAWLSFSCGLAPGAARERVRVARALRDLPRVSEAFRTGTISYSKVRAITRVANEQNEETLVTYARHATAAQLEKVIRDYRRLARQREAEAAQQQHERRSLRYWSDEEGYVRISVRLTPEDGALVIAELERLVQSGGEERAAPPAPSSENVSAETAEVGRAMFPRLQPRSPRRPIPQSRW